ncbi:hypothetical protein LZ32DRAFT_164651 [Colletotrichum eremochloae]|nr:hypothetical protein LZ32DRAFT_164651 [Colletotrichum eremochloae]
MGLFDKLPVWDSTISRVVGIAVRQSQERWCRVFVCRPLPLRGCLPGLGDLFDKAGFCRVPVTVNSTSPQSTRFYPSPIPSGPVPKPSMAAPSTFSRTQLCGTSHRVGSKQLVSVMDGVPFTAPHARHPMSLPAAALHRVSLSAATRFIEANDTS